MKTELASVIVFQYALRISVMIHAAFTIVNESCSAHFSGETPRVPLTDRLTLALVVA